MFTFASTPVVLSQVQTPTGNDAEWVKTRQQIVTAGQNLSQAPRFVAWLATRSGGVRANNAGLRYQSLGQASVQVKVEEDTTLDAETSHKGEAYTEVVPDWPA